MIRYSILSRNRASLESEAPIPPNHPTLLCHRDHRADQGNKDREQSERKSWNIELKVQGCWIIFATTDILAKLWQSEPFSRGCTYKDIGSNKRSRINLTTLIKVLVVVRLTLDTLSISFETSWFAKSPGKRDNLLYYARSPQAILQRSFFVDVRIQIQIHQFCLCCILLIFQIVVF